MTTSSPAHLVFYKKEGCQPCEIASANLAEVLALHPDLESHITVLQKEAVPELVAANDIHLYPTVLIVDADGKEIARKVGVRFLTRDWFSAALYALSFK